MMTITRTTIARKARELAADEHSYSAWRNGGHNLLSHTECREIGYRKAWDELLPAFGWPGGYAMEYLTEDGSVLCAECAREYLKVNRGEWCDPPRLYAESTDGYEGNDSADHLYCDDCGKEICRAWLREPGHPDDRDLPWSLLRRVRAEDAGVPLGARTRYQPRTWRGTRRDMTPADAEYCA